jgi:hypothetical protein
MSEELQKLKKSSEEAANKAEKPKWSNDFEFLCSCITLSVGLGNVWRYFIDVKLKFVVESRSP